MLALVGDDPNQQLSFVWMDVWELKQEKPSLGLTPPAPLGGGGEHFGWRPPRSDVGRPCHLFIYTQAFALQLRKSTENLSQGSRAVLGTARCVDLPALVGVASTGLQYMCPLRLTERDFRQFLVDVDAFQIA
jgi:hypothetical protein